MVKTHTKDNHISINSESMIRKVWKDYIHTRLFDDKRLNFKRGATYFYDNYADDFGKFYIGRYLECTKGVEYHQDLIDFACELYVLERD